MCNWQLFAKKLINLLIAISAACTTHLATWLSLETTLTMI